MFGDPGCPYIFKNEGLYCEVIICVKIQVLAPVTRTQLQEWLRQDRNLFVLCNSLNVSGHGLIWWLHCVGIFDLTLLSSTAFGSHLPPSHPHPGQQKRKRGEGQDWALYI